MMKLFKLSCDLCSGVVCPSPSLICWARAGSRYSAAISGVVLFCGVSTLFSQESESAATAENSAESSSVAAESIEAIDSDRSAITAEGAEGVTELSLENQAQTPLTFRLVLGANYDNNIYQSSFTAEDDVILSGGIGIDAGSRENGNGSFNLGYEGKGFTYLDHSDLDGWNHVARFSSALALTRSKLGFSLNYGHIQSSNPALGGAAAGGDELRNSALTEGIQNSELDVVGANATFTRDLATKMVLQSELYYRATFFKNENSQDSQDMQGRLGLGYKVTGKTVVGAAGGFGILDAEVTGQETYQDTVLTVAYEATGKIKLKGDAGAQFRQADDGGGDRTRFIFNLRADYKMRERTSLYLVGRSYTEGSAVVSGSNVDRTALTAGLNQKIAQSFLFDLGAGYELAEYEPVETSVPSRGDSSYWFIRGNLSFMPSARSRMSIFYQHNVSDQDSDAQSYDADQLGIQVAFSF